MLAASPARSRANRSSVSVPSARIAAPSSAGKTSDG
ncbi:Uncharacterised protein [Mycobacterium tuberculosis]|uniref:Uncharacterized protein n=1 Tax=Mycobacterium tuberculosis TaxID=1773 RepID=A0A916LIQ4_MYCTX|nr:Uncharacterised protein [Mycobacterium tuberculosis]